VAPVTSASALAEAGVSDRETEVLGLLGEHLSHAEIAARLSPVSPPGRSLAA
jgi:DNA-binding CsgD family transcriptional regulator